MNIKDNLDKRICDCENCDNTQTYREFIKNCEEEFDLYNADLDSMTNRDLINYLDFLDELWEK